MNPPASRYPPRCHPLRRQPQRWLRLPHGRGLSSQWRFRAASCWPGAADCWRGGHTADLDWLLDLAGGLRWAALQRLWLEPERVVRLERPLQALEALWLVHRQRSTPLQYLVGVCPWRDLELLVAPGVLIPRQETELLVDLALGQLPALQPGPLRWADLGTGSGCLAVALAAALPPRSQGYAVDCSSEALAQARLNLERADVAATVELRLGQWWAPLEPLAGQLDLVVSNPLTSPRACWLSWSRWCASTNPTWRSMAVPMA